MKRQAGTTATGAIRELGEALASGPFRVALLLSALAHLGLLLGLRGGETAPRIRPLVRLHFVREAPAPAASPTANVLPARQSETAGSTRKELGRTERLAPRPATPSTAGPVPPAATPAATPAAASPQSGAPAPPLVVPRAIEVPAPLPEPRTVPRPLGESGAVTEVPRASSTADASTAERVPVPAAVPLREPAAGGASTGTAALVAAVPPHAVSENGDAAVAARATTGTAGGVSGLAGGGGPEVGEARAVPPGAEAGVSGPAPGPSAQEIATLRRRIDARKVYPQIAIRNGWEGRVLVEMQLDLEGRLAAVRLVSGSGYSILDDATLIAVRDASPFPPIARVVTVPVEYRLTP